MTKDKHESSQAPSSTENKRKKCNSNQKLQRFRRRCRTIGSNNQVLETLLTVHGISRPSRPPSTTKEATNMDGLIGTNATLHMAVSILTDNQV